MGNLRQYLAELFGDESSDKETARQTLGIDLAELKSDISKKADQQAIETALTDKADITELSGVAFTGNYNDLINIPDAIPAGYRYVVRRYDTGRLGIVQRRKWYA